MLLFFNYSLLLISPCVLCKLLKSKSSPSHPACSVQGGKAHRALWCDPLVLPSALLSIPPQAQGHTAANCVPMLHPANTGLPSHPLLQPLALPAPSPCGFHCVLSTSILPGQVLTPLQPLETDTGGAGGAVIWVSIGTDNPCSCQPVQMGRAVTNMLVGLQHSPEALTYVAACLVPHR